MTSLAVRSVPDHILNLIKIITKSALFDFPSIKSVQSDNVFTLPLQLIMERWADKVAVVTGAASGIGSRICVDLCARGVIVVGLDINQERLEQLSREIQLNHLNCHFSPVICDLTKEVEIKLAFDRVIRMKGGVDILVNCAGVLGNHAILEDGGEDAIEKVIQTNLMAVISCTKKAFKSLCDRDTEGHIVNLCSVVGHCAVEFEGIKPVLSVYSTTKFAVKAFNQMLGRELVYYQKPKIRISNISPGVVGETNVFKGTDIDGKLDEEPKLQPKDISDTLLFILSTPGHVQVREVIIEAVGSALY